MEEPAVRIWLRQLSFGAFKDNFFAGVIIKFCVSAISDIHSVTAGRQLRYETTDVTSTRWETQILN